MNLFGKDVQIKGTLLRVARLAAERYEYLDDPAAAIDRLRESRHRIDIFTFIQSPADPSHAYRYTMEWDNIAALPVSTFDAWWKQQINGKTRNMIRRAENKGVTVREVPFDDELVKGISAIYNETPTRQGRRFWHYGKDLANVRCENGTYLDRSVFLGAFADRSLIGFAKLVTDDHRTQAGLMQILSMIGQRDKAPTNALIAHAVRCCADRAIPYLVYANFAYGQKQHDTLSDFKNHNGFKRIDVPRYYVPLTAAGAIALRLGLHTGIKRRVPEPVLAWCRSMRGAWHTSRFQGAKESL
jgi:hypothetical protein